LLRYFRRYENQKRKFYENLQSKNVLISSGPNSNDEIIINKEEVIELTEKSVE